MAIELGLAVHGAAVISSLGDDPALACAAAHAGIVRTRELPVVADAPVVGHVARHHTEGFDGPARALRLVAAVLRAFRGQPAWSAFAGKAQRLYVCAPDPRRELDTLQLVVDGDERARREAEARSMAPPTVTVQSLQPFVARAAALAGWTGALTVAGVAATGNDALSQLLQRIAKDEKKEPVLVLVFDSLLTLDALDWLQATARLKTDENPVGLRPGEAAVLFALGPAGGRAGLPELLRIERAASAGESEPFAALGQPTGRAIAQVLLAAAAGGNEAPWLLLDLNGETYRATDWGNALVHLARAGGGLAAAPTVTPLAAFGDAGAANAALALLWAMHAFARGHAPGRRAVALCCNETSARTALLLAATSPAAR